MVTKGEDDAIALHVDALCTNRNQHELVRLEFDNSDVMAKTLVSELKLKLQDLLNVPVCDQKLSYLGQPLNNPETKLSDLYLRDGDKLSVEFLEKVNIKRLSAFVGMLKKFESLLLQLCTSDGRHVNIPLVEDVEKLEDLYADIIDPLENLSYLFGQWKTAQVQVIRHYFVQEKGLESLMKIHTFSNKEYTWFSQSMTENIHKLLTDNDCNESSSDSDMEDDNIHDNNEQPFIRTDDLVKTFNEWQLILNSLILRVLWNFMETGPETQLVLQHGGLQIMLDAYLRGREDNMYQDFIDEIHENALGCLCGCVEYDANVQREVAANKKVLDTFVDIIGHDKNFPYSFTTEQECCLVANTIFYLTFDQRALKTLIEYQLHLKIMNNMKSGFGNPSQGRPVVVCYYCLLFLGRVRSSTLVTIPQIQAAAIDKCISEFLRNGTTPEDIGSYEERQVYVWMTLAPIVHMAFAGGLETSNNSDINVNESAKKIKLSQEDSEEESENESEIEINFIEHHAAPLPAMDIPEFPLESELVTYDEDIPRWPGSKRVQDIGIFALQHTLYSDDNVKLMISENLHSYLVCLLWQLEGSNQSFLENMMLSKECLHVPSLSVICKSVLAKMNGFDAVKNL